MRDERSRHILLTADVVGGVWTYALELAAALGARGIRVSLATMGAQPTAAQRAQVASIAGVELHASNWRLEWMDDPWLDVQRAGEWLLQLEDDLRPDLIHLNQFAFGALPFCAPVLLVAHSCVASWWRAVHQVPAPASWDRYRLLVRDGLRGAGLVGAPTQSMLSSLAIDHGFTGTGVVLPNGRSPAAFAAGTKEPVIFSAGRLWDAAKNLSALQSVAAELPWPVCVAGAVAPPDGSQAGSKRTEGVRWLGELSPVAMAAQFARASIYALPARYEPFGLSALEAGLARCALVLGDLPSLREVWGDAALYVAPDDHRALAATLRRLVAQPLLREQMADRASARAQSFTPQRMANAYLSAYGLLLQAAPSISKPGPGSREEGACVW